MKNKLILSLLSAAFVFNAAEAKIGVNVRAGGGYARNSFKQNGLQEQDKHKNLQQLVEKLGMKDDEDKKKKEAALEGYKDYDLKNVDLNTETVEAAIDVEYELANDWFVGGAIGMNYLFEAQQTGSVKFDFDLNYKNDKINSNDICNDKINSKMMDKFLEPFEKIAIKEGLKAIFDDASLKEAEAEAEAEINHKSQVDKVMKNLQAPYTISAKGPMYMIGAFCG